MTSTITRVLAAAVSTLTLTVGLAASVSAAPPGPVYGPLSGFADPSVVQDGGQFYGVSTGSLVPSAQGDIATGPWTAEGPALTSAPSWATGSGMWAPDLEKIGPNEWALYFAAPVDGLDDRQRCIGVATSTSPLGPFTPVGTAPLVCPAAADVPAAGDQVPGRPLAGAGVIDPSGFLDSNGARYLLYKTQQLPSSLRIVRLSADGTAVYPGTTSRQLLRDDRIVENPVLVKRGTSYVLFASRGPYNLCRYETVWMKSTSIALNAFDDTAQNTLMTPESTDLCGPGGADISAALDGGQRIFLHSWFCGSGPCPSGYDAQTASHGRRVMHVAVLGWTSANNPFAAKFLVP